MSDHSGRVRLLLGGTTSELRPDVLRFQILAADNPEQRLVIAKSLIAAKINNYAVLSEHTNGAPPDLTTAGSLRQLEQRIHAAVTVEELLGLEGAAAALWYSTLNGRLGKGFKFEKRISPNASDPVNKGCPMSQYLAAYDVTNDRQRDRVARVLNRYGERIQRSVFLLWIQPEDLSELRREVGSLLQKEDRFDLLPVDERGTRRRIFWQRPQTNNTAVIVIDEVSECL